MQFWLSSIIAIPAFSFKGLLEAHVVVIMINFSRIDPSNIPFFARGPSILDRSLLTRSISVFLPISEGYLPLPWYYIDACIRVLIQKVKKVPIFPPKQACTFNWNFIFTSKGCNIGEPPSFILGLIFSYSLLSEISEYWIAFSSERCNRTAKLTFERHEVISVSLLTVEFNVCSKIIVTGVTRVPTPLFLRSWLPIEVAE